MNDATQIREILPIENVILNGSLEHERRMNIGTEGEAVRCGKRVRTVTVRVKLELISILFAHSLFIPLSSFLSSIYYTKRNCCLTINPILSSSFVQKLQMFVTKRMENSIRNKIRIHSPYPSQRKN